MLHACAGDTYAVAQQCALDKSPVRPPNVARIAEFVMQDRTITIWTEE